MDLNKLYYFLVVARHQHVTRAAEELHIAQPALTKAMKLLEKDIGVPLFYKEKRSIHLTPYGKYLKSQLEGVFSVLDKIPDELEAMRTRVQNTVHLNVLAASTIVTDAIVQYKRHNADAVFQVIQNAEAAACDISITTNLGEFIKDPAFERRCIIEEKIYLAVPKASDYAGERSIDLRAVKDEGFVNLAGSRLFRTICDHFCMSEGFRPKNIFESDSPIAVKNLISAGVGIGFWPAFSWGKISPDMHLLPIRTPECRRELIIGLHSHGTVSPAAAHFYEYLVEFMQQAQSALNPDLN